MPPPNQVAARPRPALGWLLRLVCAVMFIGHGLMCWNGQMPLRALLWDESLVSGAVQWIFGMDWGTWAASMEVDAGINRAIRIQAWVFFFFALAVLVPVRGKLLGLLYIAAALNLLLLGFLKYWDYGMGIAQFFEHASQISLPIVLLLYFWGRGSRRGSEGDRLDNSWAVIVPTTKAGSAPCSELLGAKPKAGGKLKGKQICPSCFLASPWELLAKLSLAATFVAHGLFAVGLPSEIPALNHQRPGQFTEMTMLCLEMEAESSAGRLLITAGVLDFVVAGLIFLRRWPGLIGLGYMAVWGFLTALARPWAYYEPTAAAQTLARWIPEMLYRVPHFGLPLCLLLALWCRRKDT